MPQKIVSCTFVIGWALCSLLARADGPAAAGGEANTAAGRLYPGFARYTRQVTITSREAQKWFDQGMQLLYGFNHDEAIRSFHQAPKLDPSCAMAWWGIAYAHGLHINNPEMGEEQSRLASDAAAMENVWHQFPDDPDVGCLYAESLMNLQPWDLWTAAGAPKGRTLEIVAVLKRTLAKKPDHPGAHHLLIHAIEASPWPQRGLPSAQRLAQLVPGSGHLVHMPSHIYIRTGRYAEAVEHNQQAIAADEKYFAVAPPPDFYSLYFLHNIHFLAYAAMMEGRYETALSAARKIEKQVPPDFLKNHVKLADGFMPTTLHVLIRFGKWKEILQEPEAPPWRLLSRAERRFARAVALANLGKIQEAQQELNQLEEIAKQMTDDWKMGNNRAADALAIARRMAAGEIAYREGRREKAFGLLREAIALEEKLTYDEPPGWMQPVRHALGALLPADGKAVEAEDVYRADLLRHPNNPWSLLVLCQHKTFGLSTCFHAGNCACIRLGYPKIRR